MFPKELFMPLRNLQELHLSRTMSMSMPDWLSNLAKLRNFSYTLNHLDEIPSFSTWTSNIEELHLEDNDIHQIYRKELEGLGSLQKLFLCRNSIELIKNGTFNLLRKLSYLSLDGNRLGRVGYHSFLSNSILFMNLSNTGLFLEQYSSSSPLNFNNSMSSLDLSGTNLNTHLLNGFVKCYEALRNLNVNQNNLDILTPETFQYLTSLEELLAANNSLSQISDSFLPSKLWRQLKTLDLSGNPLMCDCKFIEFCQ